MLNQIARIAAVLVLSALAIPAVAQVQERIVRTGSVVETHRLDPVAGTYTWSVCQKAIVPNGTEQIEQANCMTQTRKVTAEEAASFVERQSEEMRTAVSYSRALQNGDIASLKIRSEAASQQIQSDKGGSMIAAAFNGIKGIGSRVSSFAKNIGDSFSRGQSQSEKTDSSVSETASSSDQAQQRKD